jgi:hypothetical protein
MESIDKAIAILNQLYGLPAAALVFCSCIVVGYILRFIKSFPNNGIPVVAILWGGLVMSLIADSRATTMPLRVWIVRNILVGMVIGMLAWIVHKAVLSKLEDWIASKFAWTSETTFFKKTDQTPVPTENQTTNKP